MLQRSQLPSSGRPDTILVFLTCSFARTVSHDGQFHSEPLISNTSAFGQSSCATSPCIPASADGAYLPGPSHFYAPTFHQVHKTFANVPPQIYAACLESKSSNCR